jgi:hypothetical protein
MPAFTKGLPFITKRPSSGQKSSVARLDPKPDGALPSSTISVGAEAINLLSKSTVNFASMVNSFG